MNPKRTCPKCSIFLDRQTFRGIEIDCCRSCGSACTAKKSAGDLGGARGRMISTPDRRSAAKLISSAHQNSARLVPACQAAGISVRTYQRWTEDGHVKPDLRPIAERPAPANRLTPEEKQQMLDTCHQPEYAGLPPGRIVPLLADQGTYIASESSFYRVLHEADELHHRGRSRKPKPLRPPQGYCAADPNQVWSWDITWLPGPIRGMFFYLCMMMDVCSRKIVGWEVRPMESAELGAVLVHKAVLSEGCLLEPPVLHADNGGPQKGFTMRAKLDALGVTPSCSRPRTSNDNPYSESLFRTFKEPVQNKLINLHPNVT